MGNPLVLVKAKERGTLLVRDLERRCSTGTAKDAENQDTPRGIAPNRERGSLEHAMAAETGVTHYDYAHIPQQTLKEDRATSMGLMEVRTLIWAEE